MEFLDVVNDKDEVIDKASRNEIYEKSLKHRIVHVLLFNNEGRLALQLRSQNTSFWPGHWSTSAGGHVRSGETYEEAAMREMKEEIGIEASIKPLCKLKYKNKFLKIFKAQYEGACKFSEEVDSVNFFSLDQIKEMIKMGDKFHPELLFLINEGVIQ